MSQARSAQAGVLRANSIEAGDSFRRHRPALLRFLVNRLGCRSTAEDITQEAYLRYLHAAPGIVSPKAFLFEVAGNLAVDHRRVHNRRAEILREASNILWLEANEITPERETIGRTEMARLVAAVDKLAPIARSIFHLIHYEGLTRQQAAETLGVSRTTVQKHERRVMDCLARAAAQVDAD